MADLAEQVSALLTERGVVAKDCPAPRAFFSVGSLKSHGKIEDHGVQHFLYEKIIGEGDTAEAAQQDFMTDLAAYIKPDTKAVLWRVKPIAELQEDFETEKVKYRVYARAAFLTDASMLERILVPDA